MHTLSDGWGYILFKGGKKMNPQTVSQGIFTVKLENGEPVAVGETQTVTLAPEPPKDFWQEKGFLSEIASICRNLEGEREQFLFDAETRQLIETINNSLTVEDFDRYSESQLNEFVNTLRRRVPQIEREVTTFTGQLTRARAVAVDSVDFI